MKIILPITVIFILNGHEVTSQFPCRNDCGDLLGTTFCTLMNAQCSGTAGLFCQRTCGLCIPCDGPRTIQPKDIPCEVGTCVDIIQPLECAVYRQKFKNACVLFARQCRATCGLCVGCVLPPTQETCTKDCVDTDQSCGFWKSEGYCNETKGFPDTRIACPLSCETCTPCPTEVPITTTTKTETRKTTTPFGIIEDDCGECEDSNEHCSAWKDEGYCDPSKGFPDTLKACPKTCDVCSPCSDIK